MAEDVLYSAKCKVCNLPDSGVEKVNKLLTEILKSNGEPNYAEVHRTAREEFPSLTYMNIVRHGNYHFNVKRALIKAKKRRIKNVFSQAKAQHFTENQILEKLMQVGGETLGDENQVKRIPPKDKVKFALDAVREKHQSRVQNRSLDAAREYLNAVVANDARRTRESRNVIEAEYETLQPRQVTEGSSAGTK